MKLKTLKEIEKELHKNWHTKNKRGAFNNEKCTEDNCPLIDFNNELKLEAIKWIKHLENDEFEANQRGYSIVWIKHFFNIKDNENAK